MNKWMWGSVLQIAAWQSWESLYHSTLNIDSMKAIDFFIAWGYIDFSLWLCFPQTQEEEKQLQTAVQIAQTFPQRKDPKTDTWQGRSSQGRAVRSCRVRGVTQTCWATLPPSCLGCWEEDTCFFAHGGFDLFASASASSFYKGHEREWVIHLSVCMWVCIHVC